MYSQKIAIILKTNYWKREFFAFDTFTLQDPTNKSRGLFVNQLFVVFIHHIWSETVLWGAVFIIQTSDRKHYFTTFQDKLHSVNIQQSWAFSDTVKKKKSKITYKASRFSILTSCGRVFEWTLTGSRLNIIKNLLCLLLLFFIYWFHNDL